MTITVARIAGAHTRDELGLRKPRSVSLNIQPNRGGSTLHWGGPGSTIHNHDVCRRIWVGWQNYHMDTHGWADIAYTAGFCEHGWVLPGRGWGVRTAAQGSNDGNNISYAFVHLNPAGGGLSTAAMEAAAWLVKQARDKGHAGMRVWAHRNWHSTDCPGDKLTRFAATLSGEYIPTPSAPAPPTTPGTSKELVPFPLKAGWYFGADNAPNHIYRSDMLKPWQRQMAARGWTININGLADTNCLKVASAFQAEKGLKVTGQIDVHTWEAAWLAPIT